MITLDRLNKYYGSVKAGQTQVLNNITLNIPQGTFTVLKGISGSGKSTLLSIIAGLMRPTDGLVEVDGENIVKLSDQHLSEYRHTKVGYITQSFNLFERVDVRGNTAIPLLISPLSSKQIQEKTTRAMRLANIDHKADAKAGDLSGGEKQRCIIARAIVNEPDILICDEPTANLDIENTQAVIEVLLELNRLGKTIIIATHDPLFDAMSIVDVYYTIDNGILEPYITNSSTQ